MFKCYNSMGIAKNLIFAILSQKNNLKPNAYRPTSTLKYLTYDNTPSGSS